MKQPLRQQRPLQRLEEVVADPALEGAVDHRVVVATRQHHDRDLPRADQFAQAHDRLEAFGVRQGVVHQHRIGAQPGEDRQRLGQRVGHLDVDASLTQSDRDEVLPCRIVLN